jgi:Beta-lactamase
MTHTQFRDDSTRLIADRAAEYNKAYDDSSADGAFHAADSHIEALGQDGVFTTVGDLAKWDRNFYDPRVGGPRAIELMLQTKKLRDGRDNSYALGLIRGTYRGLPKVEHGGGGFGSDTEMIRFPEQRLSVAVLCNMRDLDSRDHDVGAVPLTKKVLDIYLADQFKAAPASASVSNSNPQRRVNQPALSSAKTADNLNRFLGSPLGVCACVRREGWQTCRDPPARWWFD